MSHFPTPLELISSPDPELYTKMIDLTERLGNKVKEFNAANPCAPIKLLAKAEYSNPGMSHKDRIAKAMLTEAEKRGDLLDKEGNKKTILAASSGNTGCSLALVGTLMGFDVIIITNKKCSDEKCAHIRANGATLWLAEKLPDQFPECLAGVTDYMAQEKVLCNEFPDKYYSVNQYDNLDNLQAHYSSTGKEIWEQTNGAVTHFIMAGSTGGTIMGVGKFLKEKRSNVEIVLSDPHKSHLSGIWESENKDSSIKCQGKKKLKDVEELIKKEGGIQVEGAGKSGLTAIMKHGGVLQFVDFCESVHEFEAFDECRAMSKRGIMVGGSAGVNVCASRMVAERCVAEGPREGGVTITTLLCDHGIKYMSKIFNDEWMLKNDTRKRMQ